MSKLNFKIMRKSLVIIALLTVGMLSAQSKSELKKEFEQLEKQMSEINKKFDSKIQKLNKDMGEDGDMKDFKSDDLDLEDLGEDIGGLEKDNSTEELMKMFVEMYKENKEARESKDDDDFSEDDQEKKQSAKEKAYLKVMKEYEAETAKIEAKMYKIAKKYIEKK